MVAEDPRAVARGDDLADLPAARAVRLAHPWPEAADEVNAAYFEPAVMLLNMRLSLILKSVRAFFPHC